MIEFINLVKLWTKDEKGNPIYCFFFCLLFSSPFLIILFSDMKIEDIVLFNSIFENADIYSVFIIWIFLMGLVIFVWYLFNKLPAIKKNEIPMIFGFYGTCDETRSIVEHDINIRIIDFFNEMNIRNYRIIFLSKYRCNKIQEKKLYISKIQKKLNGRIIYLGKCRSIDSNSKYCLEVSTHFKFPDKTDESVIKILNDRFQNGQKKEYKIDPNNSCEEFRLFTKKMSIIVHYIIGLSSVFSYQYDDSIAILEKLINHLSEGKISKFEYKIINELKIVLSESFRMKIYSEYKKSDFSFSEYSLVHLEKSLQYNSSNVYTHELLSIFYFVNDRNLTKAMEHNIKSRNNKSPAWRYSLAFLMAYQGDLVGAYRQYMNIFKKYDFADIDQEVLDFIQYFDDEEQLYGYKFLLIMLYYYRFNNLTLAQEYYEEIMEMQGKIPVEKYDFIIETVKGTYNVVSA